MQGIWLRPSWPFLPGLLECPFLKKLKVATVLTTPFKTNDLLLHNHWHVNNQYRTLATGRLSLRQFTHTFTQFSSRHLQKCKQIQMTKLRVVHEGAIKHCFFLIQSNRLNSAENHRSVLRLNLLKGATQRASMRKGLLSFQFVVTLEMAAVGVSFLKPHLYAVLLQDKSQHNSSVCTP